MVADRYLAPCARWRCRRNDLQSGKFIAYWAVAEQYWDNRQIFILFFVGGILAQFIALAWQPIREGNSVANFNLAASIVIVCLISHPSRLIQFLAVLPFGVYIVLIVLRDIHGPAGIIGAVLALIINRLGQDKINK